MERCQQRSLSGCRADYAKEVTPAEYGIEEHESGVSKMAFVAPGKGDKIFRPGKFFAKGTTLESRRFFFNTTAAEAILKAAK